MKIPKFNDLSTQARLSVFATVILLGAIFLTVNNAMQEQNGASRASGTTATTNCTPDTILVNPCRPWLGSRVKGYPQASSDDKSQILYEESAIAGRQNDIAHTFHPVGDDQLSSSDIYLATRPNGYLLTNWKPTSKWANIAQNNAGIDKMAASIKSVAPHKIFLALHHEPQNDVTSDPNCPNVSYKGSAGTPTDYRNMWAYVHNRFAQDGVTNVVWVLIYQGYQPFDCLYPDLYPGNQYVDWVAVDDYGTPQKPNFATNIQHSYDLLTNDSDATHDFLSKPWAITEWNFCNSTSAQGISYYQQAKQAIDSGAFPRIKAWVTFDALGTGVTQIPGCLVAYDSGGTLDPARISAYKAYANDPIFASTQVAPGPTLQPTQQLTPKPTTVPTVKPTPTQSSNPTPAPGGSGMKVSGNQLLRNGSAFLAHGFNMVGVLSPPGCSNGTGVTARNHFNQTEMTAAKSWNANILRFQVSQSGLSTTNASNLSSYLTQIKNSVALAESNGFVVILSMQDQSIGCGPASALPTAATVTAWQNLAPQFVSDPNVMFELFNEPQNDETSAGWNQWLNGGNSPMTIAAVGHQTLLNDIRSLGANNVLLADGGSLAEQLQGIPMLKDTSSGRGVVYAVHPYYITMANPQSAWQSRYGYLTTTVPVIATEWNYKTDQCGGQGETLAPTFLNYLKANNIGLTAQAFDTPGITIADWSWTPTSCATVTTSTNAPSGQVTKDYFLSFGNTNPTPLPTQKPTIAPTKAPTIAPTRVPTTVPTTIATGVPTPTNSPTSTPVPGDTLLAVTVGLQGIGNGGDNANPNSQGNPNPHRTQRQITVEIYDTQNQLVVSQQGTVTFDSASGEFLGTIDLGQQFPTGIYIVKIKTDQYLRAIVPGIQTITQGQTTALPPVNLVAGDINGDNQINILDYNIIMGCYSDLLPPSNCPGTNNVMSDLNDDGNVNAFDYNLFLREMTNIGGQ